MIFFENIVKWSFSYHSLRYEYEYNITSTFLRLQSSYCLSGLIIYRCTVPYVVFKSTVLVLELVGIVEKRNGTKPQPRTGTVPIYSTARCIVLYCIVLY